MKHALHTPTGDYAYLETEFDADEEVAIEKHLALVAHVKGEGGFGLEDKEWREALDGYIDTGALAGGAEVWEEMSAVQRKVINEIKKSKARNK